jgi:hypothetical protein
MGTITYVVETVCSLTTPAFLAINGYCGSATPYSASTLVGLRYTLTRTAAETRRCGNVRTRDSDYAQSATKSA